MNRLKNIGMLGILLILIAAGAFAEGEPGWYQNKPIADIQFRGLDTISESELLPLVDEFIGEEFTSSLSWEIQSRLYALEFFEQIVPNAASRNDNYDEVILVFQMQERPVILEIEFEGNSRLRNNDLSSEIVLKIGDLVSQSGVNLDERAIKALYLSKGYTDVSIEGRIERNEENNTAVVIFSIDEGSQTLIDEIVFSGNDFASDSALRGVMVLKSQSLFNTGVYQESILQSDIALIEEYYHNRGYVDATVVDATAEPLQEEASNAIRLKIIVTINEGERFFLGAVDFSGNDIISDEELDALILSREGAALNQQKLAQDFQRVADAYYEMGYVLNTISPQETRNGETNVIDYTINIIERQQAHIENIFINGNEKSQEMVILRELPFEVGDIFNITKIRQGMNNLYNTGYFSNIDFQPATGSAEDLMDLTILVEEGRTTDINFGITFSGQDSFPVSAYIKWQDNNFQGGGQSLGTELVASPTTQSLSLNAGDGWLFGERISGNVNFEISHEVVDNITQDVLFPIFSEDDLNAVPDPYDGHYVFGSDQTYNGTDYSAGDAFPGTPTEDEIDDYSLETDYAYAGYSIPSEYTMTYESFDFTLGLSGGYTLNTEFGNLISSAGFNIVTSYIQYDDSLYRPFNSVTRSNLESWNFTNSLILSLAWDARDIYYNPSSGYLLSQRLSYVGGLLGGSKHYLSSTTKGELYFTLFDEPVSDTWNFKNVLKMRTTASFIFPQFGRTNVVADSSDKLAIDGMFMARGWSYERDGESLWEATIEYQMPIVENLVTWDALFLDAAAMWTDSDGLFTDFSLDDIHFSLGTGFRSTNPNFPIGLYFLKRFQFTNNNGNYAVDWNPNPSESRDLFADTLGLDIQLTFGLSLY